MFDQVLRAACEDQSRIPAPREAAGQMEIRLHREKTPLKNLMGEDWLLGLGICSSTALEGAGMNFPEELRPIRCP